MSSCRSLAHVLKSLNTKLHSGKESKNPLTLKNNKLIQCHIKNYYLDDEAKDQLCSLGKSVLKQSYVTLQRYNILLRSYAADLFPTAWLLQPSTLWQRYCLPSIYYSSANCMVKDITHREKHWPQVSLAFSEKLSLNKHF